MVTHQALRVRIQYYILDSDMVVINNSVRTFVGQNTAELSLWLDRYFLSDAKNLTLPTPNEEYDFHCTAYISIDYIDNNNNVEHNISSMMNIDDGAYYKLITRVNDLMYVFLNRE